ncbi:MAG: hypothetical protein J6333_12270 [Planctomycetes bacterium]|nr:hypothetical protein [Planctomycetota bacterium]
MKSAMKLGGLVAVALTVALTLVSAGCGSDEEKQVTADSPAWVAKLAESKNATQIFVVAGVGGTTAYVSMHEKDAAGKWHEIIGTPGFIGKKGLGKTKEGDSMTPIGTFRFTTAFGIADDPGCKGFAYRKVTGDDYWSGDPREGRRYNQMVNIKDLPDLDTKESEHIVEYTVPYQYCMNIGYNEAGTPGMGSAIFLHCFGAAKPYTGGCVSIPHAQMAKALRHVKKDCVVVIDSLEKLSPETWKEWGMPPSPAPSGN